MLVIPGTSFLSNSKGFPVLSKTYQTLISRCLRLRSPPWILLSDVGSVPGTDNSEVGRNTSMVLASQSPNSMADAADGTSSSAPSPVQASKQSSQRTQRDAKTPTPHLSYIRHLQRTQPPKSALERFGAGYQDYLQTPLQPLTDNLESITYEVFEKDPVKYDWYERAIASALKSGRVSRSGRDGATVIAVVGAGRGPLVTRALKAADHCGAKIDLWAIEKNPNAYVLLQRHNATTWSKRVSVVNSDMRSWGGPSGPDDQKKPVDILISELLGSFGDNELSPECLDGVQHLLNPDGGISIPHSYTAHLTPIQTPRLYADIGARFNSGEKDAWVTPYVVMLHQFDYLSIRPTTDEDAELRPVVNTVWRFEHPDARVERSSASPIAAGVTGGDGSNAHNTRFNRLTFECSRRGVCHGLAGYFETVLYSPASSEAGGESVELSTNPETTNEKSKDMISWSPIFFPLKSPLHVTEVSTIEISMWRQTDDRSVWYEWLVEVFDACGRTGTSELHTSRNVACSM